MDKSALAQELQQAVNTMYYVLSSADEQWIDDELYPAIYQIEKVITELENE